MGHPAQEIPSLNFPSVRPIKARVSWIFKRIATIDSFPPPSSSSSLLLSNPKKRKDTTRILTIFRRPFRILVSKFQRYQRITCTRNRPRSTRAHTRPHEPLRLRAGQLSYLLGERFFFPFFFFLLLLFQFPPENPRIPNITWPRSSLNFDRSKQTGSGTVPSLVRTLLLPSSTVSQGEGEQMVEKFFRPIYRENPDLLKRETIFKSIRRRGSNFSSAFIDIAHRTN